MGVLQSGHESERRPDVAFPLLGEESILLISSKRGRNLAATVSCAQFKTPQPFFGNEWAFFFFFFLLFFPGAIYKPHSLMCSRRSVLLARIRRDRVEAN